MSKQNDQDQTDVVGQESSQLGLHFEPDKMTGSDSYPVTQTFWNLYRDSFRYKSDSDEEQSSSVQLVIEAAWHTLGEMEHNSPDDVRGDQDLEMAVLVIDELVKLVIERFGE